MGNNSKHQHWVPQFYLHYFATPESRGSEQPQVWIFSKDPVDGDETLTNVRNVCGKRYLYAPVQPDGQRNWDLDNQLDKLETLLGGIWPELAVGYVSLADGSLRKGLALFVAVMYLRNPEVREEVERIYQQLIEFYEAAPRLPDGTPDVREIEVNGRAHAIDLNGWHEYRAWGKSEHDRFFTHIVQSEATHIAKLLLQKRWSVVCVDADTFITSDKPVSIQHLSHEQFGFGTSGAIITFPLSPKRLLVMDDLHNESANQYYPLNDSNAGAFNFTIWLGSSRFLVTGRPIAEVLYEICSLDVGHYAS